MSEKERVEKAIENINGLLLGFGEAVESLRKTRELLYSLIEEKEPEKKEDDHDFICENYRIKINYDNWPCYSCGCNPKGENYAATCDACSNNSFCTHKECPGAIEGEREAKKIPDYKEGAGR